MLHILSPDTKNRSKRLVTFSSIHSSKENFRIEYLTRKPKNASSPFSGKGQNILRQEKKFFSYFFVSHDFFTKDPHNYACLYILFSTIS